MYLKSLTLKGFKSFAQPTTLKLEPGICVVVGPNGSGKSNVVDALAWVMGEQGVKTLRGGSMQDVIFAGAGDRKPLGRAEVTLTIDNSDGALPIEYSEVAITRRMFRDGASEYEINGSKARLMDVQELLSDSGIGREMHVIVGQGRLAQILESKPEERRAFIEEAAGVLKHRRRKEKAQRKLVSMQSNLDRLTDLTTEMRRQLKPLEKQAHAAQQAGTIQATIRSLRLSLTAYEIRNLLDIQAAAHAAKSELSQVYEELEAIVRELSEALAEAEQERESAHASYESTQEKWFALSTLVEKVDATARIARQKSDNGSVQFHPQGPSAEDILTEAEEQEEELQLYLETVEEQEMAYEEIQGQVVQKKEEVQTAEQEYLDYLQSQADRREGIAAVEAEQNAAIARMENLQEDQERVAENLVSAYETVRERTGTLQAAQAEAAQLSSRMPIVETDAEHAEQELSESQQRVQQLREQEKELQSRITSREARIQLWEEQSRNESTAEEIAILLDRSTEDMPSLSTELEVDSGWERAVSVALGDFSNSLVSALSQSELHRLTDASLTRTSFVEPSSTGQWTLDVELPAGTQWLVDKITVAPHLKAVVSTLLAGVVAVENSVQAEATISADSRLTAITKDGVFSGALWVSVGEPGNPAIETAQKIKDTTSDVEKLTSELLEVQATLFGAEEVLGKQQTQRARALATAQEKQTMLAHALKSVEQQKQLVAQANKDVELLEQRQGELAEKLEESQKNQKSLIARLENFYELPLDNAPTSEKRLALNDELVALQAVETQAAIALREAHNQVATLTDKIQALRTQAAVIRQNEAELMEKRAYQKYVEEVAEYIAQKAELLKLGVEAELQQISSVRTRAQETRQMWIRTAQELKEKLATVRQEAEKAQSALNDGSMARVKADLAVEQVVLSLRENYGMSVTDLESDISIPEDFDPVTTAAKLKKSEKILQSLGKVNPLALEEFQAQEQRYEYLSSQLEDVEKAREDLIQVIEEVDDAILQLFTDAWHDVEQEFPKVFDTLFPGGEGRLLLTDPDDMLHTGIEIEARPPGKKVKRLSLLSGGEKSLTALALLVAIFRARPSPFYVMDEVEAALDDVNLRRLIALFEELRNDSQLIVITHQKPTMDIANVLYGVTMKSDGVTKVISQRMQPNIPAELSQKLPQRELAQPEA